MRRPESPQLDRILATVDEMRGLEADLAVLKERLATEVADLSTIADPGARLDVAVYAYWLAPEVNANQLAVATTGKNHPAAMLRGTGSVSIGVSCDRCGVDMEIISRAQMKEVATRAAGGRCPLPEGYRVVCPECWDAIRDERAVEHDAAEAERRRRRLAIARLPYADYVATPFWRLRRDRHLDLLLHVGGDLECEVCEGRDDLSVVHGVLDLAADHEEMKLLCAPCWRPLAAAGRLAADPVEANNVHRVDLDAMVDSFHEGRGFRVSDVDGVIPIAIDDGH